jgi:hypothetical protein
MVKDWRDQKELLRWSRNDDRPVSILAPNWEGSLIRYYWNIAYKKGAGHDWWSRILNEISRWTSTINPALNIGRESMFVLEDCRDDEARLLIDPWADSWKWGRARTPYHPSVSLMVQMAIASGVIGMSNPVAFGCWANGKIYEHIGMAADVAIPQRPDGPLILYHGTSTIRLKEIRRDGFSLSRKGGVYLSGSFMRAEYFAGDRARLDRKELPKARKSESMPVVLKVELWPEMFDSMRADEDWIKCLEHEAGRKPPVDDWWRSLSEFGQVKVVEEFSASAIVEEFQLEEKNVRKTED